MGFVFHPSAVRLNSGCHHIEGISNLEKPGLSTSTYWTLKFLEGQRWRIRFLIFCDLAGKDPAVSNAACGGGAGNKDGGEFGRGEEEGTWKTLFSIEFVLQLSP